MANCMFSHAAKLFNEYWLNLEHILIGSKLRAHLHC